MVIVLSRSDNPPGVRGDNTLSENPLGYRGVVVLITVSLD